MKRQLLLLSASIACIGFTSACSLDHPGNMSLKRLEVHHEQHAAQYMSHDLTQEMLVGIAGEYQKYGTGDPLTLTVQYDPSSSENTAMNAANHAAQIAKGLRKAGVHNVKTEILPVVDVGDHSKSLITYDKITAHAPSDCGTMPGLNNTKTDWKNSKEYGFGCTVEANIARQVVNPHDLVGRAGFETPADGRRAGNSLESYRQGVPNEALEGETATDN